MDPCSFVKFMLPHIKACGEYALAVQDQIEARPDKGGGSVFIQALSDADLSVQNYLEMALLTRYPDVSFYGEEGDSSLNTKYFPTDSEYCVVADPIDGTRLFLDGKPRFNVVVGLLHKGQFVASICAIPGLDECFFAIAELGAFRINLSEELAFQSWEPFVLPESNDLIITHQDPALLEKLSNLNVVEVSDEYKKDPEGWNIQLHCLLRGEIGAYIHSSGHAIDWGAIGYIAKLAGGELSDFSGKSLGPYSAPDYRAPGLVASTSHSLHDEILNCLSS